MTQVKSNFHGVLEIQQQNFEDQRGHFFEFYSKKNLEKILPFDFHIAQINCSISKKNTLRGIHFSKSKKGQSKLISCLNGKILDLVIDLRKDSAFFLQIKTFELSGFDGTSIYIPNGFGHAFFSLEENTIVSYALSSKYSKNEEFEINPRDKIFAKYWPSKKTIISTKDENAPSILDAIHSGLIPIENLLK